MAKSLLFIPDISGFTEFVQTTEVEHSQHVIAELLEVLISANTQDLQLAEVEGDALFFYKEEELTSQERLLAQMDAMFTAFYGHLKLLEKNRICPCNACATAHKLDLKIVAHSGELQFIHVQGNRKPFGQQVIEAHRLLKNSIDSDNYALISKELAKDIGLPIYYYSKAYRFKEGEDTYDGRKVEYIYSFIDSEKLNLSSFTQAKKVTLDSPPKIEMERKFPISAAGLLEFLTNYKYRHYWTEGVDEFKYNENEVTRLGSEHVCVINGKQLDFVAVTKDVEPGKLVYGELTGSAPLIKEVYQFYNITPLSGNECMLKVEVYWNANSWFKELVYTLVISKIFKKNTLKAVNGLYKFVSEKNN
ncbi:DUF2652 domain-containing protein [Maribacter sp. HTCC2170]|uniref:DUF2652 domain-containing protein n=1 Tax=Maribacter sp. (strain HTCC2170 / KCCM 42371) TaxID=313603 RepID=UPI00006BD35F|nr:DUF2652 domain-containing protein [Maribacter sp. HTCC2170]EAR02503.1 hypothetical protein FB2170_04430 [Maribacter sp. HTCC2170]